MSLQFWHRNGWIYACRNKSEIGWDVRIALSAYGSFSSKAYLNSQRIRWVPGHIPHSDNQILLSDTQTWRCVCRSRQMYFHQKIFEMADAIVTPMTGWVTPYVYTIIKAKANKWWRFSNFKLELLTVMIFNFNPYQVIKFLHPYWAYI
jgi:hypothetical protein